MPETTTFTTTKDIESVKLVLKEYPFTPTPVRLQITWETLPELWIDQSLLNEKSLIVGAVEYMRGMIDRLRIDRFLKIFEDQEQKRLDKITLFMKQVGAWK